LSRKSITARRSASATYKKRYHGAPGRERRHGFRTVRLKADTTYSQFSRYVVSGFSRTVAVSVPKPGVV
jgi:hypothetical protein